MKRRRRRLLALVTVELRNLLKTDFELFDFDYQFDDANMKIEIENAIINYFYFYEIGDYSPERFKHNFKVKFLSAIEYYNKLYNTSLLEYDPLINYTMTEALERLGNTKANTTNLSTDQQQTDHTDSTDAQTNSSGTSGSTDSTEQSSDSTETAQTKHSDYPQDAFAGDYSSETSDNDFVKQQTTTTTGEQTGENTTETTSTTGGISQTVNAGTSESEQHSQTDNTESYEKTIEGMTGRTYQELIQSERDNILRIKAMIINELKPCFLMVYN